MATFNLFTDANLTTVHTGFIEVSQNVDGSSAPVQSVLYLGSLGSAGGNTADRKLQAASSPGVAQITVSIVDASPSSGNPATDVKLAATVGGLATATAGAALNLGTQVTSSISNAKPIWIEVKDSTATIGQSTELSISINTVIESPV